MINWRKYDLSKTKEIAQKFGDATIETAAFNLAQLDLVDRGILLSSLKASPRSKQGFLDRVQLQYEFYGKFFEAGAQNVFGKGVTIDPTHWRSNAIEENMHLLNDGMGEYFAELIIDELDIESVKMKM